MDLKALLSRLEVLDKKQILKESDDRKPAKEKERDVTLPSGAKVKARTVQGWQSQKADKEADKESKQKDESISLNSGIAQALMAEFGLNEADAAAPAAAPASGEWKPTPEQEKWLGGANRQDPFIMARMPGPKPPLSYFKSPEDQQIAKQRFAKVFVDAPAAAAPAAGSSANPPASTPAPSASTQTDDDGNTLVTTASGATSVLGPDGKPLPNGGKATPAAGSSANPPAAGGEKGSKPVGPQATTQEKMDRFVYLMNKKKGGAAASAPLQLPPGAAPEPGMTVAKEDFMARLMSKLRNINEGKIFEALTPQEEQELQTISKEVVGAVQSGADGISPEVAQAVKDFQGSSATAGSSANPPAAAAPYKGSAGTQEIQKLNPDIKDVNKISVGQKIKLPGGQEYTVAKGDTMDGIAAGKFKGTPPAAGGDKQIAQAPGSSANPPAGIAPGQNARDDLLARQGKPAAGSSANPPAAGTGSGAGSSAFAAKDPRRTDLPGGGAGSSANPPAGGATPSAAPGAGKPGPTKAAAAGQDPTNPLNQKPAAGGTTPGVSNQQSSTTTSSQPGKTTTTTTSSATLTGVDWQGARNTPEWKAIFDKTPGKDPTMRERMADMKYKADVAAGKIKPPVSGQPSPATQGGGPAPKRDFEESLERVLRIAGLR